MRPKAGALGSWACQGDDGLWAGGAFVPHGFDWSTIETAGQPWTATCWALAQLREFGLDPSSHAARRTVQLVRENGRWDHDGQPYWDGEVEECINGRTVAVGAYFGVDVGPIVARLLSEQQPDGGWNCERCNGSVRSSFHTTINVLEGLLEFERSTGGSTLVTVARCAGEEYLLSRALEYFRDSAQHTNATPDVRLRDAIAIVRSRQQADGTWPLDWRTKGQTWFSMDDGPGQPSAWITLKARRVLRWWDAHTA